ncbi:MAG: FlgD immunoglobulin-like domain containing protein, partial [bacterium]
ILKHVEEIQTGVANGEPVSEFALYQNYPNPFNGETTITFELAKDAFVEVKIFAVTGQSVRTLFSGELKNGTHRLNWDGRNEQGQIMASGVYVYRLRSEGFSQSRKLVLMK